MQTPSPCRCGSSDVRTHFVPGEEGCWDDYWEVVCHGCAMATSASTEAEAVAAWGMTTLHAAASALVAKLDALGPDPGGFVAFGEAHGLRYSGPTYAAELEALREVLAANDDELVERAAIAAWIAYSVRDDADEDDGEYGRKAAIRDWNEWPTGCTHIGADGFRDVARAVLLDLGLIGRSENPEEARP